ncbi:MAG: AAA family ATPase [Algicola sp.]|nr:AAA family ATPase [Algicola sp.]
MFIKVLEPSPKITTSTEYDFYLSQDKWNDFSFKTQYHLTLSSKHSPDGKPVNIGIVKILKKDQTADLCFRIDIGPLATLDESYCSLGQSLDYYERLSNIDEKLRIRLFSFLRDVVIHPEYKANLINEEGWNKSLLRDFDEQDDIFTIAPFVVSKEYSHFPDLDTVFKFHSEGLEHALSLDFDAPSIGFEESLPGRVMVLVGRNGCGKSTLLSKISRIAFAAPADRNDQSLRKVGYLEPKGIGFPKILNISYSAFDSFQVPGIYRSEKVQIAKELEQHLGRYIFCGIRDVVAELKAALATDKMNKNDKLSEQNIIADRQNSTLLKPVEQLAAEFVELIDKIESDKNERLFSKVLQIIAKEPSFAQYNISGWADISRMDFKKLFMQLSTGHKFVLHSLTNIVAHTGARTLILFDEPETHLHPPLLAVLMDAIRYVLEKKNAFAIVATHSPVVIQETLSRHVRIIRRHEGLTKIIEPEIQTFGESIGLITSHVFQLSSDVSDYHNVLDTVYNHAVFTASTPWDIQAIMKKIEKVFSDDLSMQGRAYLMSKLASAKHSRGR